VCQISGFFGTVICTTHQGRKLQATKEDVAPEGVTSAIGIFTFTSSRILTTYSIFILSTYASVVFPLTFAQYYGTLGVVD
jgi:hypothetical protein